MIVGRRDRTNRTLRKLCAYVSAAVSSAAWEARAGIVYTDFGFDGVPLAELDLDRDGFHDFEFFFSFTSDSSRRNCETSYSISLGCDTVSNRSTSIDGIRGMGANGIVVNQWGDIRRLPYGQVVDGNLRDASAGLLASNHFYSRIDESACDFGCSGHGSSGYFAGNVRDYIGLVLRPAGGGDQFGWAELESNFGQYRVFGAAYETVADRAITVGAVPEPPSLLLLAAGAAGLAALRFKRAPHK
jgi:hypothetical protein